jgi:MFS family permease
MFKSIPFWALCTAQFGNLWGLNLILTYAPKFMAETLGFNIKASAGLAALPYLARLICSQIFGIIGDRMRKKNVMSVTKIRKFFIIFCKLSTLLVFPLNRSDCSTLHPRGVHDFDTSRWLSARGSDNPPGHEPGLQRSRGG